MVSDVSSSRTSTSSDDAVIKRKGGGTLLDSRPVFSSDSKHVYVNCVWCVRAFSVLTGERVRTYSLSSANDSVVSTFLYNDQPSAVTSNGTFLSWEAKTGKLIIKNKLEIPSEAVVSNAFLTPKLNNPEDYDLCTLYFMESISKVCLLFNNPQDGEKVNHPLNDTIISEFNDPRNVSFGGPEGRELIASISPLSLNIFRLNGNKKAVGLRPGEGRKWTCVRVHPIEFSVAAGDSTGRVVIFQNPFKKGNLNSQTVYHWHTLPCRDIAFTPAGASMYTGGGENVLVKWNLQNPQIRNYLPRLSGEIKFIDISHKYEYITVSTQDNSIKVVDPQNRMISVLQELTWGVISVPGAPLFPAGLTFDPRTRALVLNGRPGHLQFYSPSSETLLFNMDITLQNYLTQEREKEIFNTDVTRACISSNGAWMATLETREDPSTRLEQRLKFWEFNVDQKCFTLNTSIESPHNGKALFMKFRPGSRKISLINTNRLDYMLVTTGVDSKFRIWSPEEIDSVYRKGTVWGCENTCFYKQKRCGAVAFSEDGTILGVAFDETLVLWDLNELKVCASFSSPTCCDPIRFVEFGQYEGFAEVICATENDLIVWDIMTLTMSWKIPLRTLLLVQDIASSHFAVFTRKDEIWIFKPKSWEPVVKINQAKERKSNVIAALFVPRQRHLSTVSSWMQDSQLFFINSNQELFTVESKNEDKEALSLMISEEIGPHTPFGTLVAAQSERPVKDKKLKQVTGYGISGRSVITQLLKHSAHTMPAVSLMCFDFLKNLVPTEKKLKEEKMDVDLESDEGVEDNESSSSSETESLLDSPARKKKSGKTKQSPCSKKKDVANTSISAQLSEFFKDLEEDPDKPIVLLEGSKSASSFVIDGLEMDVAMNG